MKVILSHEHADFDAVASMMAMSKLEPDAIPVLPQQINHNVDQFLLLHDNDWNLTHNEDYIPTGKVELAFVVDTQAFNMVRGMDAKTPIYIVDHHHPKEGMPASFTFTGDLTGAAVTLLVERIVEQGILIDGLDATLLLLGIYEDTGNLTYKSTTPRDIRAAAWLLEHDADLDVVREYLRHTMSDKQAELLNKLQESSIQITIHGHSIMLASTIIDEQVKESALIAHELLDLMGTDAVFIIQQVRDNVQIIARSVVDDIDLGGLMRQFGGNGHARAAAGLLREASLTTVINQLIDALPEYTLQAERVEAIMSKGVQTIPHHHTVAAVQTFMMESGHEGYPVIDGERLVGLLTRRGVDRAIMHHLQNLTIAEIMEAGNYSVRPSDSVEELKDKMLETGWGQMPVVDEDGHLLGIVTRTDLIKHWGTRPDERERRRLMLEKFKSLLVSGVWGLLEVIGQTAQSQHKGLFLVGGVIRDLLLGRPNLDIDLVVEGDAIELAKAVQAEYGGSIHAHKQFGTAKWMIDEQVVRDLGYSWNPQDYPDTIDFATSRAEFYEAPTALPIVRRGSIKLDLHRRDFSINAMALRISPPPMGQLLDFYNGERDLKDGRVRVLHPLSFIDDPTRILRAVRFEQRFGFHIEDRTENLLKSALNLLPRVSGERIRTELELIFAEVNPLPALERLADLGVLQAIDSQIQLTPDARLYFRELAAIRHNPPWELLPSFDWLALQFSLLLYPVSDVKKMGSRLQMSRSIMDVIQATQTGRASLSDLETLSPSEVVARYERLGEVSWLANWIMANDPPRQQLEKLATQWRTIQPTLNGNDLMTMGLKPSPFIGELLWDIRAAWLNGELETADDEYAYIQKRIAAHKTETSS